MGGITEQMHMSIHAKLQSLITKDLKGPFSSMAASIEKLWELEPVNVECFSLMLELKRYIESSQTISDENVDWGEYEFFGKRCYSSNLRFQTDLAIEILKSTIRGRVSFTNNIEDVKAMKVDLALFGFVLCKFLLLVPGFCEDGEEIKITAVNCGKNIIISISGDETALYNRIGESCLINTVSRAESISLDTNHTLKICYDILSFYGGNLWSESSEREGLKLYFSMPANKNR